MGKPRGIHPYSAFRHVWICYLLLRSGKMSASDSNRQEAMEADSDRQAAMQEVGNDEAVGEPPMVGDIHEIEGFKHDPELCSELHELGRFAVDEHNKKQNAAVDYIRVLKAKRQVVAGIMYYLTVEVVEGATKRVYEAKVWVQLWNDFKQLQHFTHLGDSVCGISAAPAAAPAAPSCCGAPER